ncbi:MAG: hypothetical protein ACPGYY_09795 [Bacteroidia bacterium]
MNWFKAIGNTVLIRTNDDIEFSGDVTLSENSDVWHWDCKGVVVSVGDSIFCGKKIREFVKFGTPIHKLFSRIFTLNTNTYSGCDIKEGDKVMYRYTTRTEEENTIYIDGVRHVIVKKEDIEAVVRNGELIPQNGYIFVEMKEREVDDWEGDVNIHYDDHNVYEEATIKYIGKPCLHYSEDDLFDSTEYKVGDVIRPSQYAAVRLEVDDHNTLTKNKSSLFKMRRKNTLCSIVQT